jgi:hypothetical protein
MASAGGGGRPVRRPGCGAAAVTVREKAAERGRIVRGWSAEARTGPSDFRRRCRVAFRLSPFFSIAPWQDRYRRFRARTPARRSTLRPVSDKRPGSKVGLSVRTSVLKVSNSAIRSPAGSFEGPASVRSSFELARRRSSPYGFLEFRFGSDRSGSPGASQRLRLAERAGPGSRPSPPSPSVHGSFHGRRRPVGRPVRLRAEPALRNGACPFIARGRPPFPSSPEHLHLVGRDSRYRRWP